MLQTISTKLFLTLIIPCFFYLSACHADAWNPSDIISDEIPDKMPKNIMDILDKHYKNTHTFGSGINPGADQDILDYHKTEWGVSETETIKRYQSEDKRRAFVPPFQALLENRMAGKWIQNTSEYAFVFLLKGNDNLPEWMKSIIIDNIMAVKILFDAKYTIEELSTIQNSISPMLIEEFPDLQGIGIDQINNGISLDFYSVDENEISKSDLIERLQKYDTEDMKKFLDMPIKINVTGAKLQYISGTLPGGSKLEKRTTNGDFTCTAGFAHQNGFGDRVFSSAAHCKDNMAYEDYLTKQQTSTYTISKKWDENRDYQLVFPLFATPTNKVYRINRDRSASKIEITSSEHKDQHEIGTLVCNTGIVSGSHCGHISDNRFKPNPEDGCGGSGLICANTWVKVDYGDPQDFCTYGDSGGPVYANNRAYGIVSLAHFNENTIACHYLVYMPIHYIWEDHREEGMFVLKTP